MRTDSKFWKGVIHATALVVVVLPPNLPANDESVGPSGGTIRADPDAVISFYEDKVRQHPTLFAGFAALGSAYLDKARETHDVVWLSKSRAALSHSMEIQPNTNALITMAALCNFSHRFACGLEMAERAARTNPADDNLIALRVEAHLGLGQLDEAARLIDTPARTKDTRFSVLAARGRWLMEQNRFDEACEYFIAASDQARQVGNNDLIIWSEVNAAGTLLDANRPGVARPHLEAASALRASSWPTQAVLFVHWAELNDLEGRTADALANYESILERQDDPEIFRRAFLLAKKLNREAQANALFASGERAAERILAAGEIFALESQARLYADAGTKLERAEQLAQQNLAYKRDRSARETLDYVRRAVLRDSSSH